MLRRACSHLLLPLLALVALAGSGAAQAPPPAPADTIVKAILIRPLDVTLKPGQAQQFCAFVQFRDGKIAYRAQQLRQCATEYFKIPTSQRATDVKQKIKANLICIRWHATGGVIEAEVCPVGSVPA